MHCVVNHIIEVCILISKFVARESGFLFSGLLVLLMQEIRSRI